MSYDHLLFNDDDIPDIAAGLPIDDGSIMNTFPDPPKSPDDAATRLLAYYKESGVSLEVAQSLVDCHQQEAHAHTPPDPTDASHIAVKISTHPDNYTPGIRALAKAYESQRERIADLEEDVERLRPREAFVSKTLFEGAGADVNGDKLTVETERRGGLNFQIEGAGDDGDYTCLDIAKDQATQLTTALAKWAGITVWRPISEVPPNKDDVVAVGNKFAPSVTIYMKDAHEWHDECQRCGFTHWAPLPKPPVVK